MALARTIQVLIASPGDVAQLRALIPPLFTEWNEANRLETILHPKMWESAGVPAWGDHPQALLNRELIDESELLVAVFWSKLGTPTQNALSGTIEEIEKFIELKGPSRVMLYFWTKPLEKSPFELDLREIERLQSFRNRMQNQGLYHQFETEQQFRHDLYRHLDVKVDDLLAGKLPIPIPKSSLTLDKSALPAASREKWQFGNTLEQISRDFLGHWQTMMKRGDKYRVEGASLLATAAHAIDRFLLERGSDIAETDRHFAERISIRLKKLSLRVTDQEFRDWPMRFWREGKQIAEDLVAHVDFRMNNPV